MAISWLVQAQLAMFSGSNFEGRWHLVAFVLWRFATHAISNGLLSGWTLLQYGPC